MDRKRILYVCNYEGARSLIAQIYTQHLAGNDLDACCAGFETAPINGLSTIVMRECGIELPSQGPKSVFDWFAEGEHFDFVIMLFKDKGNLQSSVFKRSIEQLYGEHAVLVTWPIQDFYSLQGDSDEQIQQARDIRDSIRSQVLAFYHSLMGVSNCQTHKQIDSLLQ